VSTSPRLRHPARGSSLPLLGGLVLAVIAGCQTPQNATVAPPATGMIGQPAAYGSWATPPQGAAYPPTISAPPLPASATAPPPMPGPATQWQAAAPTMPAAPAGNSWSWSQPSGAAPPSIQQYGNQLQAQAGQAQQSMTAQAQQYANQMQGQAQQYANQMQGQAQQYANQAQQYANQQMQQANAQAQGAINQYGQQLQQALPQAQQQVTAQMPTAQPTASSSWNPFTVPAQSLPPARATPTTAVPRY